MAPKITREYYDITFVEYSYVSMDGITREASVELRSDPNPDRLAREAPARTLSFKFYTLEFCILTVDGKEYRRQESVGRLPVGKRYMLNTVPFIGPLQEHFGSYIAIIDATGQLLYLTAEKYEFITIT